MTAYLELLINASNNWLVSSILILLVTLNFIQRFLKIFWLNHKHNSFKIPNFRLYFSILLLPNYCTSQLIQRNPHFYINPIINSINPTIQPNNPSNSLYLKTFITTNRILIQHNIIRHSCMNRNSLYIEINRFTDICLWLYVKFSIYMSINYRDLYTCINQHLDISLNTDLNMYMNLNLSQININWPLLQFLI